MGKEKISNEDMDREERQARHQEMIAVLREARKPTATDERLVDLARQTETLLTVLAKKEFTTDMKPLVASLKELIVKPIQPSRPKNFHVIRDGDGLIKDVVPEY